uniref:Putative mitochondrial electron transport n=1 Tax=Corethrella appendiculata TaxID=1370023 RepID=U5EVZ6_9DIPT
MAALINGLKFAAKISNKNPSILYLAARNAGHWNKDFKPAPYPKTEREREEAAKKYGLHPSEYEPYPDDGLGYGDYPKLKDEAIESRDPYYPYDFPEHKRNFNEPIHAEIDYHSEDRYGTAAPLRYSLNKMLGLFLGCMASCIALYVWLEDYKMFRPVLKKQLPAQGVPHYTFEVDK